MASISNFSGNSYLLTMGASESITLYSMDFSTGSVTSSYLDDAGKLAIRTALYPLIQKLSGAEQAAGATSLLLSCVSVSPINGNVNVTSSSLGNVYSLEVNSVAAVEARVTIAHSVQGGFIDGVPQGSSSGVSPTYNLQTFTSSGTWTKPAGVQNVKVFLLGAGGGGGSGRAAAAGASRFSGGGGMGGPGYLIDFRAQDLTPTVSVTVGAGGVGGAPASNADGNPGTRGGATSFGAYILDSNPDSFGRGGSTGVNTSPGVALPGQGFGGYPPSSGVSGVLATPTPSFSGLGIQAGGSGAGGSMAAATAYAGRVGQSAAWAFRNIDPAAGVEAGAGGAAGSGAAGGAPPLATVPSILAPFGIALRSGGGGGGSGDLAGTVPGGAGWSASATDYGVGGGGGGCATNPQPSGAGGNGGPGVVAVLSW